MKIQLISGKKLINQNIHTNDMTDKNNKKGYWGSCYNCILFVSEAIWEIRYERYTHIHTYKLNLKKYKNDWDENVLNGINSRLDIAETSKCKATQWKWSKRES